MIISLLITKVTTKGLRVGLPLHLIERCRGNTEGQLQGLYIIKDL